MENESNKPAKTLNKGEATLQQIHGFSSDGPGTQDQDALILSAEKSKANLPPKINNTKKR